MAELTDSLRTLFSTPFCPNCATLFDADHYDHVDERASCPHCGTTYRIPDSHRPADPDDGADDVPAEPTQFGALDQFTADIKRLSKETMRQTAGGSYEMYERWFTQACEAHLDKLDPALHPRAITIAADLGYVDDPEVMAAGFGPGLCSLSGIDENYCHCGYHP